MQTLITEDIYTWQCVGLWTVFPVGQKSVKHRQPWGKPCNI